jgi:biotin carboxyl carrier protein
MTAGPLDGSVPLPQGDGDEPEGEFLSMRERLVVSPHWGTFHGAPLQEGGDVASGAVIGWVTENGQETTLVSPLSAVFVAWLAFEGEWVSPGRPVARLLSAEE